MKNKKNIFLALAMLLSVYSFAQKDTTKKVAPKEPCNISSEIGINATDLIKQVVGLSGYYFTPLPYDLTYKLIFKNSAIRVGAGVSISNSSESSYSTIVGQNNIIPGPDQVVPTINNSTTTYYRAGWEYRFSLGKGFMAYAGIDLIGQNGTAFTQQCYLNNNFTTKRGKI